VSPTRWRGGTWDGGSGELSGKVLLDVFRAQAPRVKLTSGQRGKPTQIALDHSDQTLAHNIMLATFGTVEPIAADWLLSHLLNGTHADSNKPLDDATANGALALMHGLAPRDEAEAMLCAQMIATHAAAMDSMRRARQETFLHARDSHSNFAVKLLRTYAAQMEALKRYRSGGEQKMTVEHVHVHPGAQAIVGNVSRSGEGAGVAVKSEDQPNAKQIAYAPEPAMPCADPARDRVPSASGLRETAL
jgi:hypothetical protein